MRERYKCQILGTRRIHPDSRAIGEHSQPRIGIRHYSTASHAEPLPETLETSKKECPVVNDWPIHFRAELIAAEWRNRRAGRIKEILGVECTVTNELKKRSVKPVGSGFGYCADYPSRATSIRRAVGIGINSKLFQSVDSQQETCGASRCIV